MVSRLISLVRASAGILLCITLLVGVAYPLVITAVAQIVFPHNAGGSLIEKDGKVIGSELLGQNFIKPHYFWGRPSATIPPYNAAASAASNLSPANTKLQAIINDRVALLKKSDPENILPIPVDLVTASASGLDPHISVNAALWQLPRVARHRRMKEEDVANLITAHTEKDFIGLIGQARVNVLRLNMALDEAAKKAAEK